MRNIHENRKRNDGCDKIRDFDASSDVIEKRLFGVFIYHYLILMCINLKLIPHSIVLLEILTVTGKTETIRLNDRCFIKVKMNTEAIGVQAMSGCAGTFSRDDSNNSPISIFSYFSLLHLKGRSMIEPGVSAVYRLTNAWARTTLCWALLKGSPSG